MNFFHKLFFLSLYLESEFKVKCNFTSNGCRWCQYNWISTCCIRIGSAGYGIGCCAGRCWENANRHRIGTRAIRRMIAIGSRWMQNLRKRHSIWIRFNRIRRYGCDRCGWLRITIRIFVFLFAIAATVAIAGTIHVVRVSGFDCRCCCGRCWFSRFRTFIGTLKLITTLSSTFRACRRRIWRRCSRRQIITTWRCLRIGASIHNWCRWSTTFLILTTQWRCWARCRLWRRWWSI